MTYKEIPSDKGYDAKRYVQCTICGMANLPDDHYNHGCYPIGGFTLRDHWDICYLYGTHKFTLIELAFLEEHDSFEWRGGHYDYE